MADLYDILMAEKGVAPAANKEDLSPIEARAAADAEAVKKAVTKKESPKKKVDEAEPVVVAKPPVADGEEKKKEEETAPPKKKIVASLKRAKPDSGEDEAQKKKEQPAKKTKTDPPQAQGGDQPTTTEKPKKKKKKSPPKPSEEKKDKDGDVTMGDAGEDVSKSQVSRNSAGASMLRVDLAKIEHAIECHEAKVAQGDKMDKKPALSVCVIINQALLDFWKDAEAEFHNRMQFYLNYNK